MVNSSFSSVGKKKLAVNVSILVLDIVVLALAARVNIFQEFFFVADLFPLALSIVTLVLLVCFLVLDFGLRNSFTARPGYEIGLLYVLSIFWLSFNAFSTSRWRSIPLDCSSIPTDYSDERTWCRDVQALKSLVWVQFVALFVTASFILRYTVIQHRLGHTYIWGTSLSRYNPRNIVRDSIDRQTVTDYFGRGNAAFLRF